MPSMHVLLVFEVLLHIGSSWHLHSVALQHSAANEHGAMSALGRSDRHGALVPALLQGFRTVQNEQNTADSRDIIPWVHTSGSQAAAGPQSTFMTGRQPGMLRRLAPAGHLLCLVDPLSCTQHVCIRQ